MPTARKSLSPRKIMLPSERHARTTETAIPCYHLHLHISRAYWCRFRFGMEIIWRRVRVSA